MSESTHAVEQWLPIPGWEGLYEVSDHGRIRGVDRMVPRGNHTRFVRGRVIAQRLNQHGRPFVPIQRDGRARMVKVQNAVAAAFLGPRPEGMLICHGDDDPMNNHVSNLRYGTYSDNQYDAVRNGRHFLAAKTHCKRGHLLQAPNLDENFLPIRMCLACRRALPKVKRARDKGIPVDHQSVADNCYHLIMKE